MHPVIEFSQRLMRAKSLTPDRTLCQALIAERLAASGFVSRTLTFGDKGATDDDAQVNNLWAIKHGTDKDAPLFCFLGHTDVVPTGNEGAWRYPPFDAVIGDGYLWGRGAADMKTGVAAFVIAAQNFIAKHPDHQGQIALLITGDEEGVARHGTRRVVQTLTDEGVRIDYCLVGEPSSQHTLGDVIKNGRRGSLSGTLTVQGKQGHVAYPNLADNPIHAISRAINALCDEIWDNGNADFAPTSFQISNINAGTGAANVIPDDLTAMFNFRYSTEQSADTLKTRVHEIINTHFKGQYHINWQHSGEPFLTQHGDLIDATADAVHAITGQTPRLCTGGGTSDGRFVAPTGAQVVELGVINATIHQIDERVLLNDIKTLCQIYELILEKLLL